MRLLARGELMMMIVPLILKKTFLFNFLIAVCFALQRLATQINDVLQSDCKFSTESGKLNTQEKLKDRGTRTRLCVSTTRARLEKHGKIVKTIAYDFLFS